MEKKVYVSPAVETVCMESCDNILALSDGITAEDLGMGFGGDDFDAVVIDPDINHDGGWNIW